MSGAIILVSVGLIIGGLGLFGVARKLPPMRPWQPGDRVSLIELAISKIDRNFVPAGEMPWERKVDRLICWIAIFFGAALIGLGLAYGNE